MNQVFLDVHSPACCSKQHYIWNEVRLCRNVLGWVLKTFNTVDCPSPQLLYVAVLWYFPVPLFPTLMSSRNPSFFNPGPLSIILELGMWEPCFWPWQKPVRDWKVVLMCPQSLIFSVIKFHCFSFFSQDKLSRLDNFGAIPLKLFQFTFKTPWNSCSCFRSGLWCIQKDG